MSYCPLTVTTETPPEKESTLQKKDYFLEPSPDVTAEEIRRDRLAHLLLIGFKTIKNSGKGRTGV